MTLAPLFWQVDAPFGSSGSFFNFAPLGGSYAVNPPFVHSLMDAAASHILQLLTTAAGAKDAQHALAFAVFLPGWKEGTAYKELMASPFLRHSVTIAAADHGFCDGASHQR